MYNWMVICPISIHFLLLCIVSLHAEVSVFCPSWICLLWFHSGIIKDKFSWRQKANSLQTATKYSGGMWMCFEIKLMWTTWNCCCSKMKTFLQEKWIFFCRNAVFKIVAFAVSFAPWNASFEVRCWKDNCITANVPLPHAQHITFLFKLDFII